MTAIESRLHALLKTGHAVVNARYDTTEPYAVTFGFPGAEWVISRELLAEALHCGQAGIGDVRVTAPGDLITVGLSTPEGSGWVVFRRDDLAELVAATFDAVRPGTESDAIDWSQAAEVFPGVSLR
ncbi:SsgA family sporulation/cell division regulator [Amycolatopsis thailandensis]|uniref:SsgA family sporulation/cell division regulator n=2 Tax=Amycolatopsis thailandensis TaxID=589330 RepID=UPI00365B833C